MVTEPNLSMLAWLKDNFRVYFGFSKAETNGTLVLLLLTSICLLVSQGVKWYAHMRPEANYDSDIVLLEHMLATLEAAEQKPKQLDPATPGAPGRTRRYAQQPHSLSSLQLFDINTADEVQLSTIKGIGPILSARIVKFRNRLGGFVSQAQYQEVYGLSPKVVARLQEHTYIKESFRPAQLDINVADTKTLAKHPYITYKQAQSIVNYRAHHGPFMEVEALSVLVLIDQATLKKLSPYLVTSP